MKRFFGFTEAPKKPTARAPMTLIEIANKLTDVVRNTGGLRGQRGSFLASVQSFIQSARYAEQMQEIAKKSDSKESQGPLVQGYQKFLDDGLMEMMEDFTASYGAYLQDADSASTQLAAWKDNYYGFVEALGVFSALFEDASLMQAVSGQAGLMNEWLQPPGSPPLERLISIKQRLEGYLGKKVPAEGKLDSDSESAKVKKEEILNFIQVWYGKVSDEALGSYSEKDIEELQLGWKLADFHLKWIKQSVKTPFEKLSKGEEYKLFQGALNAVLKTYDTLKLGSISQLSEMSKLLQKNAVQLEPLVAEEKSGEEKRVSDDKSSSLSSKSLSEVNFDDLESEQLMALISEIASRFDSLLQQKTMLQSVVSSYGELLQLLIPTFDTSDQISRFDAVASILVKRPAIAKKLITDEVVEKEEADEDDDIYEEDSESTDTTKDKVKEEKEKGKEKREVNTRDKVRKKWQLRDNGTSNAFLDLASVIGLPGKWLPAKAENFLEVVQVRVKVGEQVDNILKKAELWVKAPKPTEDGVFKALDDLGEMKSYQAIGALQSRLKTGLRKLYPTSESKALPIAEFCIQIHTQYKKYNCRLIELRGKISQTSGYEKFSPDQLAGKFSEWRPFFQAVFTELAVLRSNMSAFHVLYKQKSDISISDSNDNGMLKALIVLSQQIKAFEDALTKQLGDSPLYLTELRQYWQQEIIKYKPAPPALPRNGSGIFSTSSSEPRLTDSNSYDSIVSHY